jgi:hypothetical protein
VEVTAEIVIARPKEAVWQAITNIDDCRDIITSIIHINILNRPVNGLVGLKWEETREMFGKEATETMWITDAVENEYYATRAESHGSVYLTRLRIDDRGDTSLLSMTFSGLPQTALAKTLSFLMSPMIKSSIRKAVLKDLQDIRDYLENS